MNETSMSVARGLAELKNLDDRINRSISSGVFVAVAVGEAGNVPSLSTTTSALAPKIQASFDQVESLIERRRTIKAAIIKSNATTYVTVGGEYVTVAEAIEMKASVAYKETYLHHLRANLAASTASVSAGNAALEKTINDLVSVALGSDKNVDGTLYNAIAGPQLKAKKYSLFDPNFIGDQIQELEAHISSINKDLDFILSESNALTKIYLT